MKLVAGAVRLPIGATLAWWGALAALAPEVPDACGLAALVIFLAALWRPAAGLLLVAAVAPAAALLAAPPVRAAELFAWALLAGWLLRLWQPLAPVCAQRRLDTPEGSPPQWPRRVVIPAVMYGAALAGSWVTLTVSGAAGVPISSLPEFLWRAIPQDHLVFSSPEPETWTAFQSLTGVALMLASLGIVRNEARLARAVARTLVASLAVLGGATLVDIARQWAGVGYGGWFLLRYVRGERFSLHLADLNAAGSLYVLAGMAAAAPAILATDRRSRWLVPFLTIVPALWLTGSRTSYLAAVGGLLIVAVAQRRWPVTRRQAAVSLAALSLVLLAGVATLDWQGDVRGSAGRAANLRSQFLETSARMFASSPMFGVGIGRYFDRSTVFMPAELREIYGNENAHNYFAQQFAELGIVGGLLFLWLAAAILSAGWRVVRDANADPVLIGLFAAVAAYLLTCLTGHPLLVPEAALPFWIACGALVGLGRRAEPPLRMQRAIAVVACAVIAAPAGHAAMSYGRSTTPPPEHGFHSVERAADGEMFRWMTRHAVTYIPNGAGFVRVRVRAPDVQTTAGAPSRLPPRGAGAAGTSVLRDAGSPRRTLARWGAGGVPVPRPLVLETAIAGRVVDRREVAPGRWITYDIPSRRALPMPFRRIDFRANQVWTQEVRLGRRQAQRPIAVMLAEIRWIPL